MEQDEQTCEQIVRNVIIEALEQADYDEDVETVIGNICNRLFPDPKKIQAERRFKSIPYNGTDRKRRG